MLNMGLIMHLYLISSSRAWLTKQVEPSWAQAYRLFNELEFDYCYVPKITLCDSHNYDQNSCYCKT